MVNFKNIGLPPPLRSNWGTLNRGQRLYALRQYNLALRRRNLPAFTGGGIIDTEDTVNRPSTSGEADNPRVEEEHGDHIITAEQAIEEGLMSNATDKRSADVSGGQGGAKKSKSDGMALPGTGGSNDGDPDTGNPSSENAVIPRPIDRIGGHTLVFRKHHTYLSYGLAWKVVQPVATDKHYLTTTSLMGVPVEQPWFYLSPSEFDWLPRGSYVKHVKCTVVMRNPRTAFETNASTTTLATLNQNKFMCIGEALNLKTRGVDRYIEFATGADAMINTGASVYEKKHMQEVVKAQYGSTSKTNTPKVGFDTVPSSYLNLPIVQNRYFCTTFNMDGKYANLGWPQLNKFITKQDASFLTGKTVATYEYTPKVSYLKQPHQMAYTGYYGPNTLAGYTAHELGIPKSAGEYLAAEQCVNTDTGEVKMSQVNIVDVESGEWSRLMNTNGDYV